VDTLYIIKTDAHGDGYSMDTVPQWLLLLRDAAMLAWSWES